MRPRRLPGRHSVLVSWFRVFLLAMVIACAMIYASYHVVSRLVEKQVRGMNEGVTAIVRQHLDSRLLEMEALAVDIHNRPQTTRIVLSESTDVGALAPAYRELVECFRVSRATHSYIAAILLLVPDSDLAVSAEGVEPWDNLPERTRLETLLAGQREILEDRPSYEWASWTVDAHQDLYHLRMLPTPIGVPHAYLALRVGKEEIELALGEMGGEYGGIQFIADDRGSVVFSSDPSASELVEGLRAGRASSAGAAVSTVDSQVCALTCYSYLPEALYLRDVKRLRHYALISVLVLVFLGSAMFGLFVARNYVPLREVVDSLEQAADPAADSADELQRLRIYSEQLVSEHRISTRQAAVFREALRSHYWEHLLVGTRRYEHMPEDVKEILGPEPANTASLVLIQIRAGRGVSPGMLAVLASDFTAGPFPSAESVAVIPSGDSLSVILRVPGDLHPETDEGPRRALKRVAAGLRRATGADPLVVVSPLFDSLDRLPAAHAMCVSRASEAAFFAEGPLVFIDRPRSSDLVFLTAEQQRILSMKIRAGVADGARRYADEVMRVLDSPDVRDIDLAKCLVFSVFTAVLQTVAVSPVGGSEFLREHGELTGRFLSATEIGVMRELLRRIIDASCEAIVEKRRSRGRLLHRGIVEFVDARIADPGLYLPAIADHFSLHPRYVSSVFKQHEGIGLAEYIRARRIELGRSLLKQGLRVRTIAERTGFANVVTFNRTFKKETGMTPTQYREEARLHDLASSSRDTGGD